MPSHRAPRNEKGRLPRTALYVNKMLPPYAAILSFDFLAMRRRAKRPAAAAPKSNTIGGAGTSWPPLEPLEPPLDDELEEEDEDEELLLDEDDEPLEPDEVPPKLELVEVLPPLPPKLDEEPEDEELDDDELDDEDEPLEPELPEEPLEPEEPLDPEDPLLPPEPP
jgi:hypothetical protein